MCSSAWTWPNQGGLRRKIGIVKLTPAWVAKRHGLLNIAIVIERQIEGVRDARIGLKRRRRCCTGRRSGRSKIEFIVIAERLAFRDQKDGIQVVALGLQTADVAVVSGGGEQTHRNLSGRRFSSAFSAATSSS